MDDSNPMSAMIALKSVHFRHKNSSRPALENIQLSVKAGECLAILGASGSGKTSLCQLLNGLIPQAVEGELKGTIQVSGKDVRKFRVQTMAKDVGLVMQEPEMQLVGRTVWEDVAFGLRNFLVPKTEIERRIPEVLNLVGLQGFEHRRCDELSGGEKQRLAIAGTIVTRPNVLLLDELASELDPVGRESIYHLLGKLRKSGNFTIVLIERLIDDISDQIDKVAYLERGRIVWLGSPHDYFKSDLPLLQIRRAGFRKRPAPEALSCIPPGPTNMATQPLLEVKNLNFGYQAERPVLNQISLTIHASDYLAIVGHNGAGKTSLAKHFNGLIKPALNRVFLCGQDAAILDRKSLFQRVGFVHQNPNHQLFESSVAKEIAFGLKNTDLKKKEIQARVETIMTRFGLVSVSDFHPHTLSKGTKQMIAIASIVALHPRVLVIDEPTTGLDEKEIHFLLELLDDLHQKGTAIVLISHDLTLVRQATKRTIVMQKGSIVEDDATANLFANPEKLVDAGLIVQNGSWR